MIGWTLMTTVLDEKSAIEDTVPVRSRTVPAVLRRAVDIAPDQPAVIEAISGRTLS